MKIVADAAIIENVRLLANQAAIKSEAPTDTPDTLASAAYWAGVEDALRYVVGDAPVPKGL